MSEIQEIGLIGYIAVALMSASFSVNVTAQVRDYGDSVLNESFTDLSKPQIKKCLTYARENSFSAGGTLPNKGSFRVGASRCARAMKKGNWEEVRDRKLPWQAGSDRVKLYENTELRIITLFGLPSYFSRRLNFDDNSCLSANFSKMPKFKSITYRTNVKAFGGENVYVTQSEFKQNDKTITYKEHLKYTKTRAEFDSLVTSLSGFIHTDIKGDNGTHLWVKYKDDFTKVIQTIKLPGDNALFPIELNYQDGKTHYENVNIEIHFEGCAQARIEGKMVKTSLWSIGDPQIYPSFKYNTRSGLEPLFSRTKFIEYSADLGWIVNYAYYSDYLQIMKIKSIER